MSITLTDREADVMQALWEHGPSTVAEVRGRLTDDLAYTTVLTVLRILESKGYVSHAAEGRSHRYAAAVERQSARKSALRHLTDKFFGGSSELLMTHMVNDPKLGPEQLKRLRRLLAARRRTRGSG